MKKKLAVLLTAALAAASLTACGGSSSSGSSDTSAADTNNNLLVDLTPYIEDGTIDTASCNQDVLNSGKVGDGLYALCNGINAPALLYNKTLLDENGITVKDNMTMDEFIALSREIEEKTGYKTNLCYNQNEQFLEYFLRADDIVLYQDGKMGRRVR